MVELAVTLVIAAILSAIVTPGFRTMIMNNTITAQTNSLVSSFNIARSEAAKRSNLVGVAALDPSNPDNEWGKGWRVWIDSNNDGIFSSGEQIIKEFPGSGEQSQLNSINNIDIVLYDPEGFLVSSTTLVFEVCDIRTQEQGRAISLLPSGRVKTDKSLVCD